MVRWGDQWWWSVETTFHDGTTQSHTHLTLESANAIERRMKGNKDVKKVHKKREKRRKE
jgi:hypothetical protein